MKILIGLEEKSKLLPPVSPLLPDLESKIQIAQATFLASADMAQKINDRLFDLKVELSGIESVADSLKDAKLTEQVATFNGLHDQASSESKTIDKIDQTNMSQLDSLKILLQRNEIVMRYAKKRKELIEKVLPYLELMKS